MKRLIVALVLFLLASVVVADNCFTGPCKRADLPTCVAKLKGKEFTVKNCVSTSSCATTASPGFAVRQVCDYNGSAWEYRVASGSGDVLLAGDADGQTIYGATDEGDPSSVATLILGVGVKENGVLQSGTTGGSVFVNATMARLRGENSNLFFTADASKVEMDGANGYASIKGGTAVRYTYGQTPPTNATDPCTAGDTIDTATFHYYCHATDTWVRVAMATW